MFCKVTEIPRVENMKKSLHGMYLNKLKIIDFAVEFLKSLQKSIS